MQYPLLMPPVSENSQVQSSLAMDIPFSLLWITSLLILLTGLLKAAANRLGRQPNLPPSPWKLPLIGHLHHLIGTNPPRALHRLSLRFGPIMHLKLGQVDHIVISSPEMAREILKTHDLNFSSRPFLVATTVILYNNRDISFAPYGPYWRQLRKICVLELLSAKRVKSFRPIREAEVSAMIASISAMSSADHEGLPTAVNLTEMLLLLANTITARAAFGSKCKHGPRFISQTRKVSQLASGFNIADLYPSLSSLVGLLGVTAELDRLHKQIDEILEDIIAEHLVVTAAKNTSPTSTNEEDEDLVDVLLRIKNQGDIDFPLAMVDLKAVTFDMFIAGTDTSSTALLWALSELVRHPAAMERAQDEVRRIAGGKGKVEESDIEELHYMNMVIKETMRLHPPLPLTLPRLCAETCNVGGFDIPSGSRVLINAWAIGRDPRYWEDADSFVPERFEGSSVEFRGESFQFLPFGGGRRVCPGITFGLAGVELTLAQLLFHFDWKLPDEKKPEQLDMTECFGAAMGRKLDLCLIATPLFPPIHMPLVN